MADILKDDVHTYVRELILKELKCCNTEDNAPSDNRKLNKGELGMGKIGPYELLRKEF